MKTIDISGNIEPDNTIDISDIKENIRYSIGRYLSRINFKKTELSYAKLLNIALGCDGVSDITDFKVNNGYENIVCKETEIFSLNTFKMEVSQ